MHTHHLTSVCTKSPQLSILFSAIVGNEMDGFESFSGVNEPGDGF